MPRRFANYHFDDFGVAKIRSGGETPSLVSEVVQLCEGFSIASQYASFIVLENGAEYDRWKIERRNLLRLDRDRAAQRQVEQKLQRLRERALVDLGPPAPAKEASPPADQLAQQTAIPTATPTRPARSRPPTRRSNGIDINVGGGGALDPISGSLAIGLGSLGWASLRRRRCGRNCETPVN